MPKELFPIQLLTNYSAAHKHQVIEVVSTALDNGIRSIQFCWQGSDKEIFTLAEKLRTLTSKYRAELVVNNRLDVALAIGADAVHLGQQDAPVSMIRHTIPLRMRVGLTVSTVDELLQANRLDVDYYGIGPVFNTQTKPGVGMGLDQLANLRSLTTRPIIAIGGITVDNVESVLQLGIERVAIVGAVYNDPTPRAVSSLVNKIQRYQVQSSLETHQ